LAAGINALFKLSIIVALLVASSGVAYYYAVYLPRRDAQLDEVRAVEQAHAADDLRARQEQLAFEQKQAEQRQAEMKAGAETRYQTCIDAAGVTHDTTWAAECKRLAEKAQQDHADCLAKSKLSQQYCDTAYRSRDGSSNCTLPLKVATEVDGGLIKARNRCAQERKAALQ
jgi:CRISPR/Cas system-associated exonuclease Cas4 (RecB family)